MNATMQKECITCRTINEESEFIRVKGKLSGACKDCRNAYIRQYKHDRATGARVKRVVDIQNGLKQCTKCNVWKSLDDYTKRHDTSHGYRHECKACSILIMQEYCQTVYNKMRRERKKTDIEFRLISNHRNYVYKCLTKFSLKTKSSIQYIGCTIAEFRRWLEFQFVEGMTWDNYGTLWTVDHVIPLSRFNMQDEAQQKVAFHWTNM